MTARRILVLALTVLTVAAALPAAAQPDPAAAQAAWEKAGTPGPIHAFLAEKTGDWRVVAKQFMEPGADPLVSESTSHCEMMLGGRFLVEHLRGESMGQPFEGMGSTGYDNTTGEITSTWIDSMGTVTMVMTGGYEKPGDPMTVTGTMADPLTGAEMTLRSVTTFTGPDTHRVDMYMSMPGMPEMLGMVLEYTRK